MASEVAVDGAVALPAEAVRDAALRVLAAEGREASLSIAFLDPEAMRALNRQYKEHDRPTDVLSFALPLPDGRLTGDIYICPDVAAHEADARDVTLREELLRLVVHGTLHVLGWDHPESDDRERSAMWQRQERYVRELA